MHKPMGLIVALLLSVGSTSIAHAQAARSQQGQESRPNIVLIMADDLGYSDLGSYGGVQIETPNLDRLAAEGLRFTQFYNTAKCGPSRAELMSGLYWQQAGRGLERPNNVTLAEVLGRAGYHTMHVGKWHLESMPSKRGFEHSFGFLNGAVNYFTGVGYQGQPPADIWRLDGEPYDVPEDDFYTTHAFTDRALAFVEEAAARPQEEPFFLYLAYNAPHFPLQAPAATVQKYRRKFAAGWDSLRQRRYQRQRALGLLPRSWALSPRNATPAPEIYPSVPAWEDVSMERRWSEDLKMAVYAAQVEEMDRGIGQLMKRMQQLGLRENTLVIFLSDNGGCPFPYSKTPQVPPGPASSSHVYETPWANLSNTPFRGYKRQSFEGATSTPFIVNWPGVIGPERAGQLVRQVGHIRDLMPTLAAVAGAAYPTRFDDHAVLPVEGQSLLPVIASGEHVHREEPLFWSFNRNAAVRQGRWKLVARRTEPWELFDMKVDRTETNDLSEERPEKREELRRLYAKWAQRVGATFPQQDETR